MGTGKLRISQCMIVKNEEKNIEQASGDWIAFLDADEYMLPEDMRKLPSVIKKAHKAKMDILFTLWLQVGDTQMMDMAARQCRIFRNTSRIRYQEPIHEQLTYNGGTIDGHIMDAVSGGNALSIYHTGYTSEVSDQKSKRNIRILLKEQANRSCMTSTASATASSCSAPP